MKDKKTNKKTNKDKIEILVDDASFEEGLWGDSWTYIKTVVDIVHEPILILDKNLRVIVANDCFYHMFQVDCKDTEKKIIYELGNGQWNIPSLKKLLEDILPKNTFFRGFEVDHVFPAIGRKVMILNARRIYKANKDGISPEIILLAIEDVTEMVAVAKRLADHTDKFEVQMIERAQRFDRHLQRLEKEINQLRKEK